MKTSTITISLLFFSCLSPGLDAQEQAEQFDYENNLEVVVVTGVKRREEMVLEVKQVPSMGLDNSDLMRQFPGGNRNANGPVTRISQYRGLVGAHNNIMVDGLVYTPGGPNWMDSPLSSIPQSQTLSVTVHRGLGSVNRVEEGLGNAIEIESQKGDFGDGAEWTGFGDAQLGYASNVSGWGAAAHLGAANASHRLDVVASVDQGDDYEFDGGVVAATEYDRSQYRLRYGYKTNRLEMDLGAAINRTGESGTPALPMDIILVDSEQFNLGANWQTGPGQLTARISALSVDHIMNNYTLRPPPRNAMGMVTWRETEAVSDSESLKVYYLANLEGYELEFGIDGAWTVHDADITNPENAAFEIANFNEAERDRLGLYAQLVSHPGDWDMEFGVRFNRVGMNTGEVFGDLGLPAMAPPMMQMQQARVDALADAFNASDREVNDSQWSAIIKASRNLGAGTRFNMGLGRKVRSPSYQERYLWLPMEATAGLADGRTYIGNIRLNPETAIEVTLGLDTELGSVRLTPEIFYRDISDYIQGTPSTNMTANAFAMMMTGKKPLQFNNVEAEMYGFDLGYEWQISDVWLLRGSLGYVRGKRSDISDNLYRIAPLSSFISLNFIKDRWFISLENLAAESQDDVAEFNDEQNTAGWGIVGVRAGIELGSVFNLDLGVDNLADKRYQDHLGGYNRVTGSDVPLGQRLYGMGRNFYIRLNARW